MGREKGPPRGPERATKGHGVVWGFLGATGGVGPRGGLRATGRGHTGQKGPQEERNHRKGHREGGKGPQGGM